jgi:hypothetical protein
MVRGNLNRQCEKRLNYPAQGMVEFAIALPLLLLIMLAIVEFGRLLFYYSVVTTSAREAARYGSAAGGFGSTDNFYQDCDGIRDAALRMGNLVGMQNNDTDIQIRYQDASLNYLTDTCPPGGSGPILGQGERIEVTTTAHFQPIIPLIHLPTFDIQAVSRRTILVDIQIK